MARCGSRPRIYGPAVHASAHHGAPPTSPQVRITPENPAKIRVPEYLRTLGQHRFVLSPRGNGLDAHRTWEALMVGSGLPLDCLLIAA